MPKRLPGKVRPFVPVGWLCVCARACVRGTAHWLARKHCSCVKADSATYICGLEPCGPLTCPGSSDMTGGLRGRQLSAAPGTCLPGRNTSGVPLLNVGSWMGDYSYHVHMAHTMARKQQIRVTDHWATSPATNGFQVANGGNTMYWPTKYMGEWTLNGRNTELLTFNFSLGTQAYARPYASTPQIIFTFAKVPATNLFEFLAYDAQHPPNTLISNVTMKNTSPDGNLYVQQAAGVCFLLDRPGGGLMGCVWVCAPVLRCCVRRQPLHFRRRQGRVCADGNYSVHLGCVLPRSSQGSVHHRHRLQHRGQQGPGHCPEEGRRAWWQVHVHCLPAVRAATRCVACPPPATSWSAVR